ncbi:hypothetical protein V8C35DRAFT_294329 [Trichoderma chlorosporum]
MTMLSAAGRYKRMPLSGAPKEVGLNRESRVKAMSAPYDYQRLKKCNSQQALENPDWRTRPSDNSSSSTTEEDLIWRSVMGGGKQLIEMDPFPTTPPAGKNKRGTQLQKTGDLSQDHATDVRCHRRNVFDMSSELEPKVIKTLEEEQPVQYSVLKQIHLSSSKEHPLSLFEVTPLGSIPSCLSSSVVDIRVLNGVLTQRKPVNDQDEQLRAALRAAEATPHKVRMHLIQSQKNEMKSKHPNVDELRVQKEGFELGKAAAQRSATQNENRLSPNQTARLVTEERPMAALETDKDEAFQKFLMKLGQKSRDLSNEKSQGQGRMGSSYEDGSREEQSGGSTETCILRYRKQRADGQKQASLETHTGHGARRSGISDNEKANRPVDGSARYKNLNPKAREFLSFASNGSSNSDVGNMEPLQALTTEHFTHKSGQANDMPPAGLGLLNASFLQQPSSSCGYGPFAATLDTGTQPMATNNLMTGRLVPVQVGTGPFGSQFPTSALPVHTVPPLPSLLPPVLRPQAVMQSISMMGNNAMGMPLPPPMLNSAFHTTAASNPYLNVPPCQMPLMTGASCLPQPVPKPRRPDPGDQQAYEAWIEWRKANEPGYALECRLRQQRRAQRSMTDKSQPKAPPAKKDAATTTSTKDVQDSV